MHEPPTEPATETTRTTVELTAGPVDVQSTGEGPPLLLLHPALTDETFWDAVVPGLVAQGHRCVVPTMPLGAHRSAMRPDADLTPPALAELLVELIDALDLAPATIVSNDTCTALTQMVLTSRPEKVRAAVLTNGDAYDHFLPPIFRPLQVLARMPGGVRAIGVVARSKLLGRSPLAFGRLTLQGLTGVQRERWSTPLRTDAGVRHDVRKLFRGVSPRYTNDAAARFGSVEQPVLVLWGATRTAFPVHLGERLAAELPNARLQLVHESSALVPIDAPQVVVDAVHAFATTSATP